jgi:chromosome partitioning related protein ParA
MQVSKHLIDGDHAQPTASSIFPLEYEAPGGLYELLMQTVDLSNPDNLISRTSINNSGHYRFQRSS